MNEGVRGYPAYCVSVVGLGAIQIVTDGVVSRWFSTIFPSPAEQFAAAAFGRSATALAAYEVSIVVLLAASAVSYVIALAYSLEISAES